MKLLGVVTAFHPNTDEFLRNIRSYISGVDQLIIWDNTPGGNQSLDEIILAERNSKITIRRSGINEFLAKPFNICINEAISNHYTHILTMDQDSFFSSDSFEKLIEKVRSCTENDVMIFCPAKTENQFIDKEEIDVENTITSGTIYKLGIFEKAGFFREDFLIYMIDIEFGMRVRKLGYKIRCYPRILLNHYTGYAKKNRLGLQIDNYSAQSTYYIIRNVILNWKLYPEHFSSKEKRTFYRYKIVYRTLKIIFEPQPLKKLRAIYTGLIHGLTGRSGLYNI